MSFVPVVAMAFLFSGSALASVIGSWNVTGTLGTKVKVKGYGSDKQSSDENDYFQFNEDGTFQMIDMGGTWTQDGSKFTVTMDPVEIESYFEQSFTDEGLNVDVTVKSMTFSGKELQDGAAIKGSFKLAMDLWFIDQAVPGGVKMSFKFQGTPAPAALGTDAASEWAARAGHGTLSGVVRQIQPAPPPE